MQELNVNINDTKISECTSNGTRKIYLRFDQNFSDEQAKLMKHQIDERTTPTPDRRMMDSRVTSSVQPIETDELGILAITIDCILINCSCTFNFLCLQHTN